MRSIVMLVARRWAVIILVLCFGSASVAQTPVTLAGGTPCLQKLQEQRVKDLVKPKKKKGGGIFGAIGGAAIGFGVSQIACRGRTGDDRLKCVAALTAGGGVLGNVLGRKLDASAQKKVVEASYASAFSGQPSSLKLDTGCAMVETTVPVQFESRDVQVAWENGIARPAGILRAVGEPQRLATASTIEASAAKSRRPLRKLPANSNAFVMGSVDQGRWLLIGRGSEDAGYTASGYAPAAGWSRQPDLAVPPAQAAPATTIALKAELPCWTSKVTIRSEGDKAQQDTVDTRLCRSPDGTTEAAQTPPAA
jgi:hypothetical protein